MSLKSFGGRCHRGLWGLWFLALLATLILPGTREAHFCALRAFFHLSGGQTTVSPGGHTRVTAPYGERRRAAAGETPDNYLIGSSVLHEGPFPPPQAWACDPLLAWAAIESAGRIAAAERTTATQPAGSLDSQTDERIVSTLELVALARKVEPDNGLIWLAEAVARFARGEDQAALAALEVTLRKKWNDHAQEVSLRRQSLLKAEGIPAFDGVFPFPAGFGPMPSTRSYARDQLLRTLKEAVRQRDDAAIAHRLGLLHGLLDAGFEKPFVRMLSFLHYDSELTATMAVSQGVTLPPVGPGTDATLKLRREAEESVCIGYLRQHAPALAESVVREESTREAERQRRFQVQHDLDTWHLESLLRAEMFQKLALLVSGGFLAALVAGFLAWRWPPEWPNGKKLRLHREFLIALIPALALMFLCVWPVVQHLCDSESISADGSWDPSHGPLLTRAQKDVLQSAALVALPLFVLLGSPAGPKAYRAGLVLGAYSYLAATIANAFFRHETVSAATAMIAG